MNIKQVLSGIVSKIGLSLISCAGGLGLGIGIGFAFSYLVKHPGRIDTFALVESMLGIVITGLSIVAAFVVALQWSNLERKINEFDMKVKETNDHHSKATERVIKISQDIDDYVKATINGYKEKVDYLEELLSNNAKIADNINNSIKEYKEFCYKNMEEINKIVFEKQKITSRNLIDQQTNNDDETPQ